MEKSGLGGVSPFDTRTRPNVFSPLQPEEVIERRGELALWFRVQPCPCDRNKITPDCPSCYEGQIRSYPPFRRITEESAWKISGNKIFTLYTPIESVESLVRGDTNQRLTVQHKFDDYIEIAENIEYWRSVFITYNVRLTDKKTVVIKSDISNVLELPRDLYLAEIHEIYHEGVDIAKLVVGMNYQSIAFAEKISGNITLIGEFISPIRLGYRTFEVDNSPMEKTKFYLQSGEIGIVAPVGYKMGNGDFITLLTSDARQSERVLTVPGRKYDFLSHTPVIRISTLISKVEDKLIHHKEGIDFQLLGNDKINWFSDKPKEYSIMYDYHPSFRVTEKIENGSGENRERVRIYKAKSISTYNIKG